jgi:AcrR family transcriptional regulator
VLRAALELADRDGFESCTMRKVAKALGVEAMSLYNHVASKEDLLDGMVDIVFGEFEDPPIGTDDWKRAMRGRATSVREVLGRHPWAVGLMEGRPAPGPANMRHHNATMGCLREAGFGFREAVHALSAIDAYVYGFALQERGLPFETPEESGQVIQAQSRRVALDEFPYLMEVLTELPKAGYDFAEEFAFGLELILEGLDGLREG